MARLISLIAREALTYSGRSVGAGEVFEAAPIDAAILTYHRKAGFAKKGNAPATPAPLSVTAPAEPEPDPETTEPPLRRRRRYRRKDMRAED